MRRGVLKAALTALIFVACQSACRKNEGAVPSIADEHTLIGSKQFVVAHGRHAGSDNPPCIRRGMDDVIAIARSFATEKKQPSFAFVGKDIPATPVTFDDPRATGGLSVMTESLDNTLRSAGGEAARALATEGYASCGTVAFLLPKNTADVRVVLSAGSEQEGQQPCAEGPYEYTKCNISEAGWTWFHQDGYFVATFKNWSDKLDRTAKIDFYPLNIHTSP